MNQIYIFILLLLPFIAVAQTNSAACDAIFENGKKALNSKDFKKAFDYFAVVKECNPEKQKEIDVLIDGAYYDIKEELRISKKLIGYFMDSTAEAGWASDITTGAYFAVNKKGDSLTQAKYYEPQPFQNNVAIAKNPAGLYVFVDSAGNETEEAYEWLHYTNKHYYYTQNYLISDFGKILRDSSTSTRHSLNPIQQDLVNFSEETYKLMEENEKKMKTQYPNLSFPSNGELRFLSENLWAMKDSNLWIVKNEQGRVIIPALYTDIFPLNDHLFAVNLNGDYYDDFGMVVGGQWGLINAKGDTLTPIKYSAITTIKNERCMVNIGGYISSMRNFWGGKWGVIDVLGKEIVDTIYDYVIPYANNVAFVGKEVEIKESDNKEVVHKKIRWGAIDIIGRLIIPFDFEYDTKKRPQNFQDEYALIYKENNPYFIDKNGIATTRKCIETISHFNKENSLFLLDDGKYINHINTIIDKQGKTVIPLKYDIIGNGIVDNVILLEDKVQKKGVIYNVSSKKAIYHGYLTHYNYFGNKPSEGLIAVRDKNNQIAWINMEGDVVLKPQKFNQAENFREGLAATADSNDKWGFIDKEGDWIIKPKYREVRNFSEGFAAVSDSADSWKFINKNGNPINPIKYYRIVSDFSEGFALASVNNYTNIELIDTAGNSRPFCPLPSNEKFRNGRVIINSKSYKSSGIKGEISITCGLIDKKGRLLLDTIYREFKISEGLLFAQKYKDTTRKWRLFTEEGKLIKQLSNPYDNIDTFSNGLAKAYSGNYRMSFINRKGEEALVGKFENVYIFAENTYALYTNKKYGLFTYLPNKDSISLFIPCEYDAFGFMGEKNEWIRAQKNGKWGWLWYNPENQQVEVKIPFRYDATTPFVEDKKTSNWKAQVLMLPYEETFFINEKGEMILGE